MEGRKLVEMRIESVRVEGRYRRDLGNVESLAKSIAGPAGLINPITVTPNGRLIAGQRRLEACRSLGWDTVPVVVVDGLDEAAAKLVAERDENTERKEMTVSERIALGQALEELERPLADRRQGTRTDRSPSTSGLGHRDVDRSQFAETRDVVGAALGMAGSQYTHAKMVIKSASDPTLPPEVRKIAKAAQAEMDRTGQINRAYEQVRRAKNGEPPLPPKKHDRNRRPLSDVAKEAGWALRKDVERIERVFSDDRYGQNKDQVTAHLRGHLTYAVETLSRLLDQNPTQGE